MKSTIKNWIAIVLTLSMLTPALVSSQVQLQGPRDSAELYSGVVYGPIDQNDTLWRIASRYKQDGQFNVYQTMLAIYELNPQAFENKNFNTMVNGATLQLPSDRFIARMDTQRARAKAEADDKAFGRPNSVQPETVLNEVANATAVPEIPLVNQEDLSATKQELQRQLNSLNRQQNTQFGEVKDQVASSIANVQALLEENRRLYDSLDQVNQDITELRGKVEGDMQGQIDQQLALQKEIIDLVKQAEQRALDKEAQSIWTTLSSPIAVIGLSFTLVVGVLVLLGIWLLRKPKSVEAAEDKQYDQADIIDDELVIGEMDDDDADDLMAALDQEMADDDILSSDLEDGLDELGVGDTDFGDVDDMLVPDTETENKKPVAKSQIVEEDISFDTDAISLDDDDFENQEIDLPGSSATEASADSQQEDFEEHDATAEIEQELTEGNNTAGEQFDTLVSDKPTASETKSDLDDATQSKQSQADPAEETSSASNELDSAEEQVPADLSIDEDAEIDDDALEQIETEINKTTEQFENLSSEILNELDNVVDEDEDLDSVIDDSEVISLDDESAEQNEETPEPNSEYQEDVSVGASDEVSLGDGSQEAIEDEQPSDPIDTNGKLEAESTDEAKTAAENTPTQSTDTPNQDPDSEELDELLEKFAQQPQQDPELGEDDINLDSEEEPHEVSNALADELPSELEDESVSDDDLDALLDEFTNETDSSDDDKSPQNESAAGSTTSTDETAARIDESPAGIDSSTADLDDSDALLDDIPSLSDMGKPKTFDSSADAAENDKKVESAGSIETEDNDNAGSSVDDDTIDEDEDVLADLPGLDDWLSDEELEEDLQSITNDENIDSELNLLADIEGSDFEELLSEIDAENSDLSDDLKAFENKSLQDGDSDEISRAGLDLDSLMQDDDSLDESIEDFVNVDDLLSQSDALTPLEDEDIALDLDKSLGRMNNGDLKESSDPLEQDREEITSEQASNLDLAQVYMDMDDFEAATEVLEEVKSKGSPEQISEANELLQQINKA